MVARFSSITTVARPRDGVGATALPAVCRRLVVVAPRLADEVRGAALLTVGRTGVEVDVLGLTSPIAPPDDADDPLDEPADPHDAAVREPYALGGVPGVRRHRLGLDVGDVAAREADVVAALSEILGWAHPSGLCVLAPVSGESSGEPGDDRPDADAGAAGRVAELVCAAYSVRLLTWEGSDPGVPAP